MPPNVFGNDSIGRHMAAQDACGADPATGTTPGGSTYVVMKIRLMKATDHVLVAASPLASGGTSLPIVTTRKPTRGNRDAVAHLKLRSTALPAPASRRPASGRASRPGRSTSRRKHDRDGPGRRSAEGGDDEDDITAESVSVARVVTWPAIEAEGPDAITEALSAVRAQFRDATIE